MRILVISNLYPYKANQVYGIFTARQFEMAAKLGADITVFFPIVWIPEFLQTVSSKWKNYNTNHTPMEYKGVKVITVPYIRFTKGIGSCRWDGLFMYRSIKKQALKMHKEKPFDVIYGKGIFPSADAAVRLSKILKIPAVGEGIGGDVHVAPDYSKAMYKHFLWITHGLTGAVADGKGVADRLSKVMKKDIPTIHGLVNLDEFSPVDDKTDLRKELNMPADAIVLLFVGNLVRPKGIYELVNAFGNIKSKVPNCVLRICGSGVEKSGLETLIAESNLKDSIEVVGAIRPSEVHKWMKASDIFVLPSYSEGMPNVVMEAMSCGLPVISTKVGGLPDSIGDCRGAILVEPKNVDQLTEAILKLSADYDIQTEMSIYARKKAGDDFSAKKNLEKMLDYLKEITELNNRAK